MGLYSAHYGISQKFNRTVVIFTLQKRISDDISKKLTILEDSWSKDKLCKPVKQRMAKLAEGELIMFFVG